MYIDNKKNAKEQTKDMPKGRNNPNIPEGSKNLPFSKVPVPDVIELDEK